MNKSILILRNLAFRKVLLIPHVINIATIPSHNKFLVYCGNGIRSYSLDLLGRVAMQTSPPQPLDASREDVTGSSDYVFFMKVAKFAGKSIRTFSYSIPISDLMSNKAQRI